MNAEITEYYTLLTEMCPPDARMDRKAAYRRLRQLLDTLCRTQLTNDSLQMTDLAARINFAASRLGLSTGEQNRLHTVRLTANHLLNNEAEVTNDMLLRDIKTTAFFIRKLTGENPPENLLRKLPKADATYIVRPPAWSHVKQMRVCYEKKDEHFLYVWPTDNISNIPLRVRYNVLQVNDEFRQTCNVLWKGAQLNLLDVDMDRDGVLTPAFLVLEPDYLIDISSLAECFKEYGHHPANYVLTQLKLSDSTPALLLGNIANLFLDEWIHAPAGKEPGYRTCMRKAFRLYALSLSACPELSEPKTEHDFFDSCALHFKHIRHIVLQTFNEPGYKLNRHDALLEPTYLCEALGLQGRLDYMQRDGSAFIEMKSGKADEFSLRGRIEPKENNLVQMLLYQAVMQYSLGIDHHHVKAYLLYTRYPLLYPARSSWSMVKRAIDVRNRIVANEHELQRRNDPAYTEQWLTNTLDPSILNERQLDNKLWKYYLKPSIEDIGKHFNRLSALEKAYFCTLYNFIGKEIYAAKSGESDTQGNLGAASLWLSSAEEKTEAGEMLYGLTIAENHASDAQAPCISFRLPVPTDDSRDVLQSPANFRPGDAILFYERNTSHDNACNRQLFKGAIASIGPDTVTVRLRLAQQNTAVLPSTSHYAMERDYMDTVNRNMYRGLTAFLYATTERRELLLAQRAPRFDTSLDADIAEAYADDFRRITLKAQAAQDYFLLVGPPGTGKTSRALRSMVEAFLSQGKQLLMLSYTNRAVDEMCKMLSTLTPAVPYIRIGNELNCDPAYRPHLLDNILSACNNRHEARNIITRCPVIAGTVATLSARTDLFALKTFDVALVDEATQILEPQLLGLLCMRQSCGSGPGNGPQSIGKFILIGDHKQLPAVVLQSATQSEVSHPGLRNIGLHNLKDSLFERLYRSARCPTEQGGDPRATDMLCRQGRMNEEVAVFPNQAFYGGLLRPIGLPHQHGSLHLAPGMEKNEFAPLLTRRTAFIPSEPEPPSCPDKTNHNEADTAARLAAAIYRQYQATEGFNPQSTLGIITPYRSQIALIRNRLALQDIPALRDITVDTVERYQGSERDVIIYSFSVNRLYQLRLLPNLTEEDGMLIDRKLNVALTRARKQMFVIGAPQILDHNPLYAALIKELGSH